MAVTLAMPEALVSAVAAERFAEAPVAGTTKTTVAPVTGLPEASLTKTASGSVKGELTAVLCGEPPIMVRVPGRVGVFVSPKEAVGVPPPGMVIEAVTL